MYDTISIKGVHYTHCMQSGVYVNILDEGAPIAFIRFLRCSVTKKVNNHWHREHLEI